MIYAQKETAVLVHVYSTSIEKIVVYRIDQGCGDAARRKAGALDENSGDDRPGVLTNAAGAPNNVGIDSKNKKRYPRHR